MNSTKQDRARLRQENRKQPKELAEVPRSQWAPVKWDTAENRTQVFRSRDWLVQTFSESDGSIRISVNRTDQDRNGQWRDGITWEELMEIKRQCGYGKSLAVEFYPPDSEAVNVANMRHLFLTFNGRLPQHWTPSHLP